MKTIGIIGGMSWESSLEYYRIINELTKERLGGLHSAKSLMLSVDFAHIEELQSAGRWEDATAEMVTCAKQLERGGADFLLIATNTMHLMFNDVQESVNIPCLHIADAAAGKIMEMGLNKVGLLGTQFTMEMDFYKGRLKEVFGIDVVIPDRDDRAEVNRVIYEELVVGRITPESRSTFKQVIDNLAGKGAEGVVLGCTEIPLLVKQEDASIPIFDTTFIHAEKAVDMALAE